MYKLLREFEEVKLKRSMPVFCDTETCIHEGHSDGGLYGRVRLFQIYQKGWSDAIIFDLFFVDLKSVLDLLDDYHLVFHNGSYDLHTINLHTKNLWLPYKLDDTVYLSRLTYFDKTKFDFFSCLKYAKKSDELVDSIDKKENQKYDWSGPLTPKYLTYAACDVIYLADLYEEVKHKKEEEVYKLDIFNQQYAIEYNRRGIPVNQEKIQSKLLEFTTEWETLLTELPVNPNSPKQCQEFLNVPKTDMSTLVYLAMKGDENAGKISRARSLSKLINYTKKYDRPIIYGFHNPCAAISGRFACDGGNRFDHGNLQQIPHPLLECLEAPEGKTFVYKDYSGIELRMGVAFTGEPVMEHLYRTGRDCHTHTGSRFFDIDYDAINRMQRTTGKVSNFLLIYGGGVTVLMASLRNMGGLMVPMKEAKLYHERWFEEYDYFNQWHNIHKNHLNTYRYLDVTTALGRKVRTYDLSFSLNVPIQGSTAEVTKTSLHYLKTRYPDENLVNTVHDSNILLVDKQDAEDWKKALNECMVDAWYYVIKDLAIPDLPMPAEATTNTIWSFD